MSRSNICPFLNIFTENVFVWTKVKLNFVAFTLMFLQVIGTSVGFGNVFPVNLSGHCFHRSTSFATLGSN